MCFVSKTWVFRNKKMLKSRFGERNVVFVGRKSESVFLKKNVNSDASTNFNNVNDDGKY